MFFGHGFIVWNFPLKNYINIMPLTACRDYKKDREHLIEDWNHLSHTCKCTLANLEAKSCSRANSMWDPSWPANKNFQTHIIWRFNTPGFIVYSRLGMPERNFNRLPKSTPARIRDTWVLHPVLRAAFIAGDGFSGWWLRLLVITS